MKYLKTTYVLNPLSFDGISIESAKDIANEKAVAGLVQEALKEKVVNFYERSFYPMVKYGPSFLAGGPDDYAVSSTIPSVETMATLRVIEDSDYNEILIAVDNLLVLSSDERLGNLVRLIKHKLT